MKYKILISIFVLVLCVGCTSEEITNTINDLKDNTQNSDTNNYNGQYADNLKIASFNIQILGQSKMDKPLAIEYLPKIINEFDVVAIQELRDSSGEAIEELHDLVPEYNMVVGPRLGRSTSKEQYVVFYKKSKVLQEYTYDDPRDVFEREPYIVYMESGENTFSLIINHIKPDDATTEIKELENVIRDAKSTTGDEDFIVLGDLNADCTYYDEDLQFLRKYDWVIGNDIDTTVGSTDCTYDRIITNMVNYDSGVFNYEFEYNLVNEDAKVISDHFPVYVVI